MNADNLTSNSIRRGPYRSRNGWIFGVCRGIAEFADIPAFWIRLAFVISTMITGLFPMPLIYLLLAIFMKPEPVVPTVTEDEEEFYSSYANNRQMALNRLRRRFDALERRTRRVESVVIDKEFEWERRLNRKGSSKAV